MDLAEQLLLPISPVQASILLKVLQEACGYVGDGPLKELRRVCDALEAMGIKPADDVVIVRSLIVDPVDERLRGGE